MRAILLSCFTLALSAQDSPKGVNFYSLEKELALGQQIARQYRVQATLIERPELKSRVDALVRSLLPPDSKYTYSVELTASDNTLLQEPAAFPGGFLFIPSGLILAAQNIDELAGMIAHSIAHIEAQHGARLATKAQIIDQATVPLIFMGGWSGYAIQQSTALAIPLAMVKAVRAHELQADVVAAQIMSAAGFQPGLLADYIERVQPADSDPPNARFPLPARAERVAALRALPAPTASPNSSINLTELQDLLRRELPADTKVPPRLAR
jgi:predicted Zn-dependent protease